jgi:tripartite ATP-independent transporter DctM subunit
LRFGIATPTEVGAIAVLYSLIVGMILRSFTWKGLFEVIHPIAIDASLIGLLIGAALPFSFVLTTERVPELILNFTMVWFKQDWLVLLFMNLILLVAGMFMDIGAAILIFAPLFYPLAMHVGINDVHFAMIIVCNLMLGGITPPVGMLAYIAATVTKIEVMTVFKEMGPFFIALLFSQGIITFVPAVSLVLLWLTGN